MIEREQVIKAATNILENNIVATLCTTDGHSVHANNIYYAYNNELDIVFVSDRNTVHGKNIQTKDSVSLVVYNEPEAYGVNHQGIQIEGACKEATGEDLVKSWLLYVKRFPVFKNLMSDINQIVKGLVGTRIYIVKVSNIKIMDIPSFGKGNFSVRL